MLTIRQGVTRVTNIDARLTYQLGLTEVDSSGPTPLPVVIDRQYFVPGWGMQEDTTSTQYFVPGWGMVNAGG